MEGLRQYVFSVASGAILSGLVTGMMPKGTYQKLLRLICGVFMALLVIRPMLNLDLGSIVRELTGFGSRDGEAAAAFGEEMARDSMAAYIKRETEAYILDKANELGITAEVQVLVGKEDLPVPSAAVIRGTVPQSLKLELERLIEGNLGISKENLQWIG